MTVPKSCPIEPLPIAIPADSKGQLQQKAIPFQRLAHRQESGFSGFRSIPNRHSAFIDGSAIYGPKKSYTDRLRAFKGGRMLLTEDGWLPTQEAHIESMGGKTFRLNLANPVKRPWEKIRLNGNNRGNESPGAQNSSP